MRERPSPDPEPDDWTTLDVARRLNLAVRSVQLMVDRGELDAWRTPGGHRRISRASVERWLASRQGGAARSAGTPPRSEPRRASRRILLIEDSRHYQTLVSMLLADRFPDAELHIADNGIPGLAMAGQLQPDLLIVDILLPGIDGATLITNLRSHPQFSAMKLLVITSLTEEERAPYAFALGGVPVVHKPDLVRELPPLVAQCLERAAEASPA
ncbi:response regulator [Piscinibacter sakaiensis]|uniref:Response regulator receiver protein n=1 Tax=Piscinibacter sakaiensis TaxID=1547922 RepID=A0A0K8P2K2_PISS1|nr:response regulator [Piscinibacter sakaiensis]GAP36902.1 response regulator receiver protein [Piscinibacter sakaiensis]